MNGEGNSIRDVAKRAYEIAASHGFHDTGCFGADTAIDQKLLLAVGELVEAQNELRDGKAAQVAYFEGAKPEGFPIELADAVIRIFDLAVSLGIDIQDAIEWKMAYNEGRPYKHGKAF